MEVLFSIVILTKNSLSVVPDLIDILFSQKFPFPYEIIFMDNSSTDGTVEYLQSLKQKKNEVQIVHVPEGEFSHSGTRMKAAGIARGKFVVFFTDDVVPIGHDFLDRLTRPVREGKAAASYGVFQIGGKREFDPIDAYLHNDHYKIYRDFSEPLTEYCWSLLLPPTRRVLSNFDNCASCIDKNVLLEQELPPIPYGEDMIFAKKLILNGYRVAHVKNAKFYHWHKVKFSYMMKRMCIDQHLSIPEFDLYYISSLRGLVKNIVIRVIHRIWAGLFKVKMPVRKKFYWVGYNGKVLVADFLGKYMGTLDGSKLGGILGFLKGKLYRKKMKIVEEIEVKSILRY
jgi:rhamnosyltransferase